jgi:hypothetical protein
MKKHERFGDVLDVILHHLREGNQREAAAVINAVPDEEIRNFCWFLALHVERDLDVLRGEVENHWTGMENTLRPNLN